MQNTFGLCLTEDSLDLRAVCEIGLDEVCACRNGVAAAVAEIVDDRDGVPGLQQECGDGAADVASAPGDDDLHGRAISRGLTIWTTRCDRSLQRSVSAIPCSDEVKGTGCDFARDCAWESFGRRVKVRQRGGRVDRKRLCRYAQEVACVSLLRRAHPEEAS